MFKITSLCITIGLCLSLSACSDSDNDNPATGSTADNFSTLSRAAYAQPDNAVPVVLNDRNIVQDVTSPDAYDDLISSGSQ